MHTANFVYTEIGVTAIYAQMLKYSGCCRPHSQKSYDVRTASIIILQIIVFRQSRVGCVMRGALIRQHTWVIASKQKGKTMDDLISRQAAKNKKVYSEERHEYVIPIAEIDWLPSAQQWIPCSERPPEIDKEVLVTDGEIYWVCSLFESPDIEDGLYQWEDNYGHWHEFETWVAWMPLPEPYKGEES